MKKLIFVLGLSALCLPATASAHFNLVMPPSASGDTGGGKGAPPCGPDKTAGTPTAVQGGHPLTISISETIQHTGFYRFALALSSPSELPPDNVVYSGPNLTGMILPITGPGNSGSAAVAATPVFPVLADGMYQHTGGSGTLALPRSSDPQTILLPNVTCASCTLQVIEFMQDHGPNPGGGYFYHHCASLKITADPALPAFTPPGMGGSGGGGASGAAGVGGLASGGGGASAIGGSGGASAGAAGTSAGGGIALGGAPTASGGSSGGSPSTGNAGQTSSVAGAAGNGVTGAAGAGTAAPADNGGGSCSLSHRAVGATSWAALLGGLLLLGRRRRRASH